MERNDGSPKGLTERKPPIPLGTKTPWGKIAAIGCYKDGERYYMMDRRGSTSLIPADILEPALAATGGSAVEPARAEPSKDLEAEFEAWFQGSGFDLHYRYPAREGWYAGRAAGEPSKGEP